MQVHFPPRQIAAACARIASGSPTGDGANADRENKRRCRGRAAAFAFRRNDAEIGQQTTKRANAAHDTFQGRLTWRFPARQSAAIETTPRPEKPLSFS
jgi:hypothetical protein